MKKKTFLVFASGTPKDGGSGFKNVVEQSREKNLAYNVVAVVSNHREGGVREKAEKLKIPFKYFGPPWDEAGYRSLIEEFQPDFVTLSGWVKCVKGLNPAKTTNSHPGPTWDPFGGRGMYGHRVHEKVLEEFKAGRLIRTAVSMHFVTPVIDGGPVFLRVPVGLHSGDTVDTTAERVNKMEHAWQPVALHYLARGLITLDLNSRIVYSNELVVDNFWFPKSNFMV